MPRLSKIGAAALAAFGWTSGGAATAVTASYLQVAGGGGGGGTSNTENSGGGGGAGGLLSGTTSLNPALSYTVVVGAGGAGALTTTYVGTQGSSSQFDVLTASVGGGFGQGLNTQSGGAGGSGGGTTYGGGSGGAGTAGQGNAGGIGNTGSGGGGSGNGYNAGGGGGAGAVGSAATGASGGNGGIGSTSSISGTSTYYAGGGGGGSDNFRVPGVFSAGGLGGGGAGGNASAGISGTASSGGGGGGASLTSGGGAAYRGGNGGSGVVIISYAGAQQFGGGVVTSSGGNTIHTFTTSGTLSPLSSLTASYLIVAGGGGGGMHSAGGGGAGGLLSGSGMTIDTNSTYLVTVGSGGTGGGGGAPGGSGGNSTFSLVTTTAIGGGGGGGGYSGSTSEQPPTTGGSGGGGGALYNGAAGTSGQGNTGGNGYNNPYNGGGGGGAGGAGVSATNTPGAYGTGGNGGVGIASSISGTSTYYAGGGGGAVYQTGTPGAGGNGGGGAGTTGSSNTPGVAGTANTGGGGGGSGVFPNLGGAGGSGIVIISYAGSTQLMAGGTVTISGGNVIHTFTSSGYLTPLTLVGNSLRFRASASGYLSRSITATPTAQNTWTYSAWVKRGQLGISANILSSNGTQVQTLFTSGDNFQFYVNNALNVFVTTQVFRDPAAWYHIVLAVNSSESGTNKVQLYVNGTQVTSFSTDNRSSFSTSAVNQTGTINTIGNYGQGLNNYFDGYLADINFIDGQQLTPNSFGTFNQYGVWQPIRYGGSYGTNGFYLPFNANSSSFAGSFNGSNQYLTAANNAAFNLGSGSWTIEFWMNPTAAPSIAAGMIYKSSFSSNQGWWVIYYPNYIGFGLGSGSVVVQSAASSISAGRWTHVAIVNNAGTGTIYINGVASGTASISSFTDSSTVLAIGAINTATGWNGDYYYNGNISNVRVVKGTAVYTSNFKPATSNLTAITNTSLLTLQNATIVDNSTNAFTITNNNTVTTGQTYPFSAGYIFNDQGPAGNNWTPNNISGVSGTTLDYMTDVPTLTSTTAANYCVMNPNYVTPTQVKPTISNGNLTLAVGGSDAYGQSTFAMPRTGKYYWEVSYNSTSLLTTTGIATATTGNGTSYVSNGQVYILGVLQGGTVAAWSNGDVIGMAIDMDANTVAFYRNNTLQTTVTAYSGTADVFIASYLGGGGTGSISYNYGQRPFTYTPPSGFLPLNTFNL
jgi:hypothetical protein